MERSISIKELREWFVYFDLGTHEKSIKDKEMTAEDRSNAILAGFGVGK